MRAAPAQGQIRQPRSISSKATRPRSAPGLRQSRSAPPPEGKMPVSVRGMSKRSGSGISLDLDSRRHYRNHRLALAIRLPQNGSSEPTGSRLAGFRSAVNSSTADGIVKDCSGVFRVARIPQQGRARRFQSGGRGSWPPTMVTMQFAITSPRSAVA